MLFASPVPAHTMFELDGATATSPTEATFASSNTGRQFAPPFVDFHTPPVAAARYTTVPRLPPRVPGDSATATSGTRPLITAGPIERTGSELTSAESVSAAPPPRPPPPPRPALGVGDAMSCANAWTAD